MELRKRKLTYVVLGPLPQVAGYVAAPLLLARDGKRHGWRGGRPSAINLAGVGPLIAGAAMLGWAIASHYQEAPKSAPLTVVPTYLAERGAYSVTRNPMYVGGAAMQVGWSVLLGSTRLAMIAIGYLAAMDLFGVPFEERLLERRFGYSYIVYKRHVPRWLPTTLASIRDLRDHGGPWKRARRVHPGSGDRGQSVGCASGTIRVHHWGQGGGAEGAGTMGPTGGEPKDHHDGVKMYDDYLRRLYRGGRPGGWARLQNRASAFAFGAGIWPTRLAALDVRGRRSARVISFPVVIADYEGERYLVSMLGERANWVRNVRAEQGQAVLRHGRRERVRLEEVPNEQRAPILRRYLEVAPGARPHVPVNRSAPIEDFERIARDIPIFRIAS